MKSWRPISSGGKFFVQFAGHIPHEDSRGRPVHYRSIENARKAADLLNLLARHNAQMLIAKARKASLAAEPGPAAIDHINGNSTAAETLAEDDFSLSSHRRIFLRMTELMNENHAVDIVTLSEKLFFYKERDSIGGVAYLASLTEGLPRRPRIKEYIAIVKEKAKLRRIMLVCFAAIAQAADQSTTASDIVEQLGIGVRGIKEKRKP